MEVPVTLPDYLEAVFVSPDATRMAVYRNGDSVDTEWKMLQVRMRKEVTNPKMLVPWGELIVMVSLCGMFYINFGFNGELIFGVSVWVAQRIESNVKREIETRRRLQKQDKASSHSAPTS